MSKRKYTPGPWRMGKYNSVVSDNPVGIGGIDDENTAYYGGHLICESVTDWNARLIACAPDLLATLKDCVDRMQKCRVLLTRTYPGNWGLLDIWKSLDVINKAEGHDVAKYPLTPAEVHEYPIKQTNSEIMQKELTENGFTRYIFKDQYGEHCSIQKSSAATEDCIWMGKNAALRMHLTQDQVKAMLPILQKFVETGEI